MANQPKSRARSQRRTKSTKSNEAFFTIDEIERIRMWAFSACAGGDRRGALLVALLGTAGRRFEVAALRCGDVRPGPGGPEVFFPEVKGGGNATVPTSVETFNALDAWKRKRWLADARTTAPLIPTESGGFMHVATLWRLYKQTLKEIGIKRNTGVHATRHAAGFLLLRATGDLTKVQHFLRHTSLSTTDTWYKHVHMPDLRAGIERARL